MIEHQKAARDLLQSYDAFMRGEEMYSGEMERFHAVCHAISFGVAAYEAGAGEQAGHAMGRAFLTALFDPSHPDLDYLRAVPESGEVARLAASDLATIAHDK